MTQPFDEAGEIPLRKRELAQREGKEKGLADSGLLRGIEAGLANVMGSNP